MSEIVDQVLDSVTNYEPSDVVVEDVEESPPEEAAPVEEVPVEEVPVEETPVEEAAPVEVTPVEETVEETVEEETPVEVTPVEETVEETVDEEATPVEETRPIDQVVNEIREILTEPVVENNSSDELTDDLKQRIAELDYLRECFGNWIGQFRPWGKHFLVSYNKSKFIDIDSNINYEDTLNQLEKFPEIVKLWEQRKVTVDSNHFKNIESYTLEKPLFNEKNLLEKVEVIEQLVSLLTDCANKKIRRNQIEEAIDNLY